MDELELQLLIVFSQENILLSSQSNREIKDLRKEITKLIEKYIFESFSLDLRQIIIIYLVIRIHVSYIRFCWSSQYFYNLKNVIETRVSDKERSSIKDLQKYAT